jgi:hypothetical protein
MAILVGDAGLLQLLGQRHGIVEQRIELGGGQIERRQAAEIGMKRRRARVVALAGAVEIVRQEPFENSETADFCGCAKPVGTG